MDLAQRARGLFEIRGIAPGFLSGPRGRIGLALAVMVAASAAAILLNGWISGGHYAALMAAVTVVTLLCGPGGGLLALLVATLMSWLVFAPAFSSDDRGALVLLVVLGFIDIGAITFLLRSNARMREAVARAEGLVESLRLSEARFRGLLEAAPDSIIIADAEGRIVLLNAEAERMFGYARSEMLGQDIEMLMPERFRPRHKGRVPRYLENPGIRRMGDGSDMFARRKDGTEFPIETNLSPLASRGQLLVTSVVRDLSARREIHERQSLLIRELNHRVKNTLASVQSIVAQTLRSSRSPDDFNAAFAARISALSQSHDLLTRNDWSGALVRDIVLEQVNPYAGSQRPFDIEGPAVKLGPNRSVTLGMVVGELATNAAKFGSLSGGGTLTVAWEIVTDGEQGRLRLAWREQGGPPVSPPTRQGFGSRLIQRSLVAGLQGSARLDYLPDGLVATLEFPLLPNET